MNLKPIAALVGLALTAGSLQGQVGGTRRKPGDPRPPAPGVAPVRSGVPAGIVIKPPGNVTPVLPPGLPPAPARAMTRPAKPVIPFTPPGTPPSVVIRPAIVNPPGPVGGPGTGMKLTQRIIRGPLSIPPRKLSPPTVVLVSPATPIGFLRVYDGARSVVVVSTDDGQKTELPYLPMPLLFAAGTTNLLDQSAVDILQSLGGTLLELYKRDNNVRFVIEGHTSTDREAPDAVTLSTQRASRIQAELVSRYHVPATIVSFKGLGDAYADYRDGTEEQMQLDRRVLVVRTQ